MNALSHHARRALPALLAGCCLVLLGWHVYRGLGFVTFMDEATHIVGGHMLARGGYLYRDFVDSHGPLIFALVQGYGTLFGWSHNNGARVLIALFGVGATLSLLASPVCGSRQARAVGVIVGSGLLALVWLRQGLFLVSFYPVGGAIAAIGLSGFVGGACFGRWPGRLHALFAGIATALLAATAYSFLPCLSCFVLAALWAGRTDGSRRGLAGFLAGLALAGLVTALWMLRFADLHGYLSYHLAESQTVYAHYIGFGWWMFRHGITPSLLPSDRVRTFGMLCLVLSLAGLFLRGTRRGPFLLVVMGVLSLNARGAADFQNGSFLWAAITLLALTAARVAELAGPAWRQGVPLAGAALVALSAWFLRPALFQPFHLDAHTVESLPHWPIGDRSDAPFFATIRQFARPGEPILGLIYQPQLYLLADRLPMDGFYAWFPWDADYARKPHFNRGRDLCVALERTPPPVIVLDPSPLWGHAPFDIAPCLPHILGTLYVEKTGITDVHGRLFVRRDRG